MLGIIIPSRGRPKQLEDALWAISDHADRPDKIIIYAPIDLDDERLNLYRDVREAGLFVCKMYGAPERLTRTINNACDVALNANLDVIGFMGDDHLVRTRGFDTRITAAVHRNHGLVYCDDGHQHDKLPTAAFWHRDILKNVGYYVPNELEHMYIDNYWLDLATRVNRSSYLEDVLIEHMHPHVGKSQMDSTYARSEQLYDQDRASYEQFRRSAEFTRAVDSIRYA